MQKIPVVVGSTRRPKLGAVSAALEIIGPKLCPGAQFEITGGEAPSGVRHTPFTRADIMAGARNRAEALLAISRSQRHQPQHYFVGLEGGLDVIEDRGQRHVFLENWAYVLNGSGRGYYGLSGGIELPDDLAHIVVDEGVELGEAIDAFAGERGVRDAQGAWGVLTSNLITRQGAFVTAVINAFAPFYNGSLYVRPRENKSS